MIYSLEDKTKKELIEIVKIQIEEYQQESAKVAALNELFIFLHSEASTFIHKAWLTPRLEDIAKSAGFMSLDLKGANVLP